MEILDFTFENYKKKVTISQDHLEFQDKINESLTEFFKISEKFDHNVDFLKQSLKIFEQNKEDFQDIYANFLENLDFTVENYKKKVNVSQVHLKFQEKINESLAEFFKISEKIDHNVDFLNQSLKIFNNYNKEF